MKKGDRVKVWNGDKSEYLGEGVYEEEVEVYGIVGEDGGLYSESDPTKYPNDNLLETGELISGKSPKIKLDSGKIVYGSQVWWDLV